ncbi:MAG: TRAP transporter substrate-binding protein DctP [Reyranella sp.]|uniref:TRAP transporter substrate-binding protein DctP n=1 Tax=Reyranella sp. TaxID=1929291 RepID=UPI001AD60166|nr:TRAP transporter substrate-binding protein DctP [Reyranella sp.]MBN9089942.1 TRAP transporter substrate-binding protein DctP [Reyranella sp.]
MIRITRRHALASLAAGSLAAPAVVRAQSPTTWIVYTYVPAATLAPARVFQEIVERVAKETNGGLVLKYHLGGALTIKGTDITTAVGDNVIQIGDDGMQQGNVPITGILRLPMLITSTAELDKAIAVMKPYVDKAYDKRGATVLATYYFPLQFAWSTKKLASLDDFKGQKIRATSPEQIEFLKRFGANGLTISGAEVPSALERGVVDGVLTAQAGGGKVWKDLLKSNFDLGLNFFEANIAVNKEAYAKLPAAQREVLTKAIVELAPKMTKLLFEEESQEKAKGQAEGIVQTAATAADYKRGAERMASYWDEWAKRNGAEAQEALKKVREVLGR